MGDEIKPNEAIRITYNGQIPRPEDYVSIMFEITKMGAVEGRILIRVKGPEIPKETEIWVLAPTALYLQPGTQVYIKYKGPITLFTNTAG